MKRVAAIDLLRALAIIGMVASGQMFWNTELPAFMFHAQVPPPTFVFNPDVAGITWVDLVFPFFLFSMGASMPLALRRREQKGEGLREVAVSALHRFVWLASFAIVLGNTRMGVLSATKPWVASLVTLGVWVLFFAMFVRVPNLDRRKNAILNWCGFALLVGVTMLYKPLFGVEVSLYRSDVIILILASMALFGTLLWWATRNSTLVRVAIIGGVALLKMASSVDGSWCQWLWQQTPAVWLFRFEFLKYLCLVLSGTMAGDVIYRALKTGVTSERASDRRSGWLTATLVVLLVAIIVVTMWGLFVREVATTVAVTLVLCAVVGVVLANLRTTEQPLLKALFALGVVLFIIGLVAEPMEGGIKKDHATVSYFFVTGGLASFVLTAALALEIRFGVRLRALEACGANPMFAYTASGYLLTPILTLTSLSVVIDRVANMGPWWAFGRGVLFALLVIAVTYPFTRKNYFWKS
ncbi:MAG: DUF5009 domain-containing protein [Rikenellaceae bacterium]|nr:DUF5009 domain-containing protein [Rikenellaceae bacterium]MBR2419352.1 DUF5009 domain-containing protein [Rikenellaceae bacterium]